MLHQLLFKNSNFCNKFFYCINIDITQYREYNTTI